MSREEAIRILGHIESEVERWSFFYDPEDDEDEDQHALNIEYLNILEQYHEARALVATL